MAVYLAWREGIPVSVKAFFCCCNLNNKKELVHMRAGGSALLNKRSSHHTVPSAYCQSSCTFIFLFSSQYRAPRAEESWVSSVKTLRKQEGELLIKIKNIKPLRHFLKQKRSDEQLIFFCKAFVCLKWAGNLSGMVQLLVRRKWNTFYITCNNFCDYFCDSAPIVMIYCFTSGLFESICNQYTFKRTRHPGTSADQFAIWLFIQGFIPKMCTVTLPLKSNRPSHYHQIIPVLQILLPTADLSLRNSGFAPFPKMAVGNLLA